MLYNYFYIILEVIFLRGKMIQHKIIYAFLRGQFLIFGNSIYFWTLALFEATLLRTSPNSNLAYFFMT